MNIASIAEQIEENCCQAADCPPGIQQTHANTSIRFPQRPFYRNSHSPGVVRYIFLHWPRLGCPPCSAGCECSLRYRWSRYPSWLTFQIIRNNWVGTPLDQIQIRSTGSDPSSHREHRLNTWAHLHQPRRLALFVGASHRAPSSDLSYMSCTQRMLSGSSFGLGGYVYADDTQLHGSCQALDAETLSRLVLHSIEVVRLWMAPNRLRLNLYKIQFIWFGTRQQLSIDCHRCCQL